MNVWRAIDRIFPYIEKLTPAEQADKEEREQMDIAAIEAADWSTNAERALDEAQKVSGAESERVRTAESKATTYLAVLAALVPVIITLQAAYWENKAGPAPDAARLTVLVVATIYVAAAGYHAFMALHVSVRQRVGEAEIAAAWKTRKPLHKLTRDTLLATRRSRDAVNAKITRILVTHQHLLRAFIAFVFLLLLDPFFYAIGFRNARQEPPPAKVVVVERERPILSPRIALPLSCLHELSVRAPQTVPTIGEHPAAALPGSVSKGGPATTRKPGCPGEAKEMLPSK
ncbi:hypothetical protein [Xanthobacter wiegelii]|uniref:hypothetical protein n=1 Tax=Xanthobacter wiegelii TaxID=3119913 RepID=UPI00372C4E57